MDCIRQDHMETHGLQNLLRACCKVWRVVGLFASNSARIGLRLIRRQVEQWIARVVSRPGPRNMGHLRMMESVAIFSGDRCCMNQKTNPVLASAPSHTCQQRDSSMGISPTATGHFTMSDSLPAKLRARRFRSLAKVSSECR